MLEYFIRFFQYEFWATERVLDSLAGIDPLANEKIFKITSHVILANQVWLYRILGKPTVDMDRFLSLIECQELFLKLKGEWKGFLLDLSEAQISQKIGYQNSKGIYYETALSDILVHIVNHGSYHRGQIAGLVKQASGVPASTDFIGFVRQ